MFKFIARIIAEYKYKKRLKKRLQELRKQDPFIYD